MGCLCDLLCPSKKRPVIDMAPGPINNDLELRTPLKTEENESGNADLEAKKDLALYLVKNDINIFNRCLKTVEEIGKNPEAFNQMFEGNTEYNYNIDDHFFKQLVAKFYMYKEFLFEFYNQKKYYPNVLEVWKGNNINSVKQNSGNRDEQLKLLESVGINPNSKNWDDNFRRFFFSVISNNPTEECAEKIKYFIKNDFPELDSLIKASEKCKKEIAQNEDSSCAKFMQNNISSQTKALLTTFVNNFFDGNKQKLLKMDTQIEKVAKDDAIQKIMKSGINRIESEKIVNNLIKKYGENKFTGEINVEEEYSNIKGITLKFYDGTLDAKWKEKMQIIAGNEVIKRTVVCLSLANVCYNILDISQKLYNYHQFREQLLERFDQINRNFTTHKNKIGFLPKDIDAAVKTIQEIYLLFKQDRDDIIALIEDINSAINNVKTERNKSIFGLCQSVINLGTKAFLAVCTKGTDRIEHIKGGLLETLDAGKNISNIAVNQGIIADLKKKLDNAKKLQDEIEGEMEKLKRQYENLRTAHFGL